MRIPWKMYSRVGGCYNRSQVPHVPKGTRVQNAVVNCTVDQECSPIHHVTDINADAKYWRDYGTRQKEADSRKSREGIGVLKRGKKRVRYYVLQTRLGSNRITPHMTYNTLASILYAHSHGSHVQSKELNNRTSIVYQSPECTNSQQMWSSFDCGQLKKRTAAHFVLAVQKQQNIGMQGLPVWKLSL